jgi:hypothetical protein
LPTLLLVFSARGEMHRVKPGSPKYYSWL